MAYVTQMQLIERFLAKGAAAAMTLEQFIKAMIDEWNNSKELELMLTGQRYYEGEPDILKRIRKVIGEGGELEEVKNLANNKLVHNFVRKLVNQKVGYLLSLPFSIQTNNEDYLEELNKFFDKAFMRSFQNLGKEAINKGKAWLHVYYNEDGELSFKQIPSEEIIPLWKDAAHTELDAVIRIYQLDGFNGTEKTTITKVEYWDRNGVKRYILIEGELVPDVEAGEESSHFMGVVNGEEQGYNWEKVPFVCFKYNHEEIPLIKFVKSLVDDYDKHKSDNSNNLEDLPNGIYVLKNYDGQDLGEFRRNLSLYRAVKVTDEGGVDTLTVDADIEAYKHHLETTRKDIFEFGGGVDTQTERFGTERSGVALKFLYADLDMDANMIECEFQASLEQLRWFIDQHIYNTTGKDYSEENVDFIFNRDIIINENDVIMNAKNSVGVISKETIVSNHPWVTNVQDELERIEEERQEEFNSYFNAFGPVTGDNNGEE